MQTSCNILLIQRIKSGVKPAFKRYPFAQFFSLALPPQKITPFFSYSGTFFFLFRRMAQPPNEETLVHETKQERHSRFSNQLWQAAAAGALRGSLIALVTGYALSYKYNYGKNKPYFRNVYKVWWFVCWNVVGVTFATDTAKMNISRQAALEDEIKRTKLYEDELAKRIDG